MESNRLPIRIIRPAMIIIICAVSMAGCSSTTPRWIDQSWTPIDTMNASIEVPKMKTEAEPAERSRRSNLIADRNIDSPRVSVPVPQKSEIPKTGRGILVANRIGSFSERNESANVSHQETVRGQDPGYSTQQGSYPLYGQNGSYVPPTTNPVNGQQPYTTYSPPQQQGGPPAPGVAPNAGDPNQIPSYFDTPPPVGNVPPNYADIDVLVRETQTGKITFGAAYNSNSGLVGQIIIDERNFDILGFPRNMKEIVDGTAFRGRGQGFRLELVPGNRVQRYLASFTEPYLFNSAISFSASGYYFDRRYFDWNEQRLGGRVSLGYRLAPDLSVSMGLRMEDVNIYNPRVASSPQLNSVLGGNALYLAQFSLINDTRDHPFMASDGSYLELTYNQGFGDFDYPRGDLDYRKYFLVTQRPDGSGRHTLSLGTKLGFSGSSTPLFENYYAGGFSTLRGFDFRGASPVEGGVRVGGQFQWLNTVEYTFPITADDMFKGVLFCDFGTVEQNIEINKENFRVAPGFGFRVHMPVGGAGGAPLAFDFAFPVNMADTDDKQIFSFYMGVLR